MSTRNLTLLASWTLALVMIGCTDSAPPDRPRLLAPSEARTGELSRLPAASVAQEHSSEVFDAPSYVQIAGCGQGINEGQPPRLVFDRTACDPLMMEEAYQRVD